MGQAAGRFSYLEDPDGAWIEFVETHKVPVMEKVELVPQHQKPQAGKTTPPLDAEGTEI
ncbi:MAG: hypothetical protein U5L96_20200 [Owenweeksia sp.]|nr:hypothetical protein [Owenweeksia sp.]